MKKKSMKKVVGVVLLSAVLMTACQSEKEVLEEPKAETESQEETTKDEAAKAEKETEAAPVEAEKETEEETEGKEEKTERLNTTKFENLPKVVEQAGFDFRAPKEFTNGCTFEKFSIGQQYDKDENGENIGEPYTEVVLQYAKGFNTPRVYIHQVSQEVKPKLNYVYSKEINGIEVSFTEYVLHNVEPDYEMTEADWEEYNSGKGAFSTSGEDERYDSYFRDAYWVEDNVYYWLMPIMENAEFEEVEQLVEEYLNAEYQGEK